MAVLAVAIVVLVAATFIQFSASELRLNFGLLVLFHASLSASPSSHLKNLDILYNIIASNSRGPPQNFLPSGF